MTGVVAVTGQGAGKCCQQQERIEEVHRVRGICYAVDVNGNRREMSV